VSAFFPPGGGRAADAEQRPFVSRAWAWLRADAPGTRDHVLTRELFLRLLGLVYLFAFWSLWPQILGLVGHDGILPARDYLTGVRAFTGADRYWNVPTLAWLSASDGFLRFLCGGGILLSLLLVAGVLPGVTLALLWVFYLSLVTVGQDFLSYQWDALLLETGFLAIFLAPARVLPRRHAEAPPSRLVLWLLRLLLFRLMFFSGVVKLASGDPAWRSLTALAYHYHTQPIPTPLAWYADHLPMAVHEMSAAVMLMIELLVPWLIFGPRRLRHAAFVPFAALQLGIAATGNYGSFNLLTIVLCTVLLDDLLLRRLTPARHRPRLRPTDALPAPHRFRRWVVVPVGAVILCVSAAESLEGFAPEGFVPRPVRRLEVLLYAPHIVNTYGLFAVMTTTRPEIVVEGSEDGRTWKTYEFRYKAGDVRRPPPWVAPHLPRLDWQMWFAALGGPGGAPWFESFVQRLLEGSPSVTGLLARNPFPHRPPRYVRATLYDYRFTIPAEARRTGAWWTRREIGPYFPEATLGPASDE
jgi:hypothetical protein